MKQEEPIFEYLESIAEFIPTNFYWADVNGICLGLNTISRKSVGATSKEDVIGKSAYEFYKDHEIADKIQQAIDEVIQTGIVSTKEDKIIDATTKKVKYFSSTRAPLKNKNGEIIGLVGTAIEITAQKEFEKLKHEADKETERLKLENERLEAETKTKDLQLQLETEAHKAKILQYQNDALQTAFKEQEKFESIVGQMLHDIQSPLASLRMTVESTNEIPEQKRITLRASATNIIDITSNLLSKFSKDDSLETENNKRQTVLVSAILFEAISDRRYKYKDMPIKFEYKLNQLNAFLFIKVGPSDLKRSISNLINNAVDALPNSRGKIELNLRANEEWVYISILDDGKGMNDEVLTKIKNKVAVSADKEDGHGIGLTQVRGMLERNHGEFDIMSSQHKESHGTTITLKFPRAATPDWVIDEISLKKNDTVIILDDDTSIHGAWDSRFEYLLEKEPNIKIKHFSLGKEVIEYVANLPESDKDNICFLSDYELINQNLNGLEVIAQCKIKRSILVTSHHANSAISKQAIENNIKILPKDIVYIAPFKII